MKTVVWDLARAYTVVMTISLAACSGDSRQINRYIVTATPLQLLKPGHPGFCIAVDPSDAKGVWWWEPGRSGCSSRSTGPEVFRADRAHVTETADAIGVQFEIQLMKGDPLQVTLTVDDKGMRREPSGERVAVEQRHALDVPESCCPQPLR